MPGRSLSRLRCIGMHRVACLRFAVSARLRCCLIFRTVHRGTQRGLGCRPLAEWLLPLSFPADTVCRLIAVGISSRSPVSIAAKRCPGPLGAETGAPFPVGGLLHLASRPHAMRMTPQA